MPWYCPITTGDTALRSLRLILSEALHIRQDSNLKRLGLAVPLFAVVYCILIYAKLSPAGFNTLWKYFGWANQTIAVFALSAITIWLMQHHRKTYLWVPAIPLAFYSFIISSYILSAQIGFHLPWAAACIGGAVFTAIILIAAVRKGR